MGIVRFALRFPHTFYVVAALILFLGVAAIRSMPTDIFPEIRIPVVTVIWQYTGLSTPEMEQRVTTYSQYSISANVNGIKNMEAQTLNGLSIQKISFQPDVNLDLAVAQIVSATNSIRALMPPVTSFRYKRKATIKLEVRFTRDKGDLIKPRILPQIRSYYHHGAANRRCAEGDFARTLVKVRRQTIL